MGEAGDRLFPARSRHQESIYESHYDINESMDPATCPAPYSVMSSGRIFKNLFVLSFSQFLFFLGFVALSNLQSTVNSEQGMGTESQAAIYASSMVASLLLPDLMIKTIGCKWSFAVSVLFSIPYIAANFSPGWTSLLPSAIFLGLAAGPLTASIATYINEMARRYRRFASSEDFEALASRFFGIYSFTQSNNQIWGNLISYYVLRPAQQNSSAASQDCGVNFRPSANGTVPAIEIPTDEQRHVLVVVYCFCGLVSVVMIVLLLDSLENDIDRGQSTEGRCKSMFQRLLSTAKQAQKIDQWLLVPISIFCGLEIAFYTSEFTQAFIACSWGVQHVGFVTVCYGVSGAIMSALVGPLVRVISQMSALILAAVISVTTYGLLFVWHPSPEHPALYFVFAALFGITDSIWWSQVQALYGIIFPDTREAAFSNFFFWAFFGNFISFSYSSSLTVAVKINILIIFLITGIVLYVAVHVRHKCGARAGYVTIVPPD